MAKRIGKYFQRPWQCLTALVNNRALGLNEVWWCTPLYVFMSVAGAFKVHSVLEKSLKVLEFLKKIPGPWKSLKSRWIWIFHILTFLHIKIFNPYPGSWGVKCPPVHFCLCSSKTIRDTAMRFWDVVKDSEGYLSPYKVLSHLFRKCQYGGWKSEIHFKKSAKSRAPNSKYPH